MTDTEDCRKGEKNILKGITQAEGRGLSLLEDWLTCPYCRSVAVVITPKKTSLHMECQQCGEGLKAGSGGVHNTNANEPMNPFTGPNDIFKPVPQYR